MLNTGLLKKFLFAFIFIFSFTCGQNREGFEEGNLTDGPYVFYNGKDILIKSCLPDGEKMKIEEKIIKADEKSDAILTCIKAGYKPARFDFKLKKELNIPECEYQASNKIFAISDIEGNFASFTQVLKNAKVLDDQLNWKFGDGHLVVIGDIFDRGIHVTECLWLLYSLEDQAQKHGGYVHVMLGNHDMMNLRGDLRYIEPKYKITTDALGISYRELFGVDSELGRWLRTKNSVIKIGENIFVHGGLSPELLEKQLSMKEINDKMRDLMYIAHKKESDETLKFLAGSFGPMWYRGLITNYKDRYKRATESEVESILKYYRGSKIFVGHTIVEKPESYFNGKVIAVDVKHTADHVMADPENISWGVLIENEKMIRIDLFNNKEEL